MDIGHLLTIGSFVLTIAVGYGVAKQTVKNLEDRMNREVQAMEDRMNRELQGVAALYNVVTSNSKHSEEKLWLALERVISSNHEVALNVARIGERVEHMNSNLRHAQSIQNFLSQQGEKNV